jgi:hypothetical protein
MSIFDRTGFAMAGSGDTTITPTLYIHPKPDQITFYDLPGYSSTIFKKEDYISEMKISDFRLEIRKIRFVFSSGFAFNAISIFSLLSGRTISFVFATDQPYLIFTQDVGRPGDTTIKPKLYIHPKNNQKAFYDLPGYSSTMFKKEDYISEMKISDYDFFFIFFNNVLGEDEIWLVCELRKLV